MNDVALVMCLWKRIPLLDRTLRLLSNQKYKNFDIFLWNNNNKLSDSVESIVKKYSFTKIQIQHSLENIGGIGRFYYSKKLYSDGYKKIIFIDDDQIFDDKLILDFVSKYEPKSLKSWWAWRANDSYFDRKRCVDDKITPNYCGTGGMICDAEIFSNDKLFSDIPKNFQFIEDLWISYFAQHILKWKLGVILTNLKIEEDGKDQYVKLKKDKDTFYKLLKQTGW